MFDDITIDGENRIRFCGGTWAYCDGDCEKCIGAYRYIISTHTDGISDDTPYSTTTDTSDEEMYI